MSKKNGRGELPLGAWIAYEPLAKDGLKKWREYLEEIVAPRVTTKRTAFPLSFQGRTRYQKQTPNEREHEAVLSLQFLYGIEAAWDAGDINELVCYAVAFGKVSQEVENWHYWNTNGFRAIIARRNTKTASKKRSVTANMKKIEKRKSMWVMALADVDALLRDGTCKNPSAAARIVCKNLQCQKELKHLGWIPKPETLAKRYNASQSSSNASA
jgi:hypothetical protein